METGPNIDLNSLEQDLLAKRQQIYEENEARKLAEAEAERIRLEQEEAERQRQAAETAAAVEQERIRQEDEQRRIADQTRVDNSIKSIKSAQNEIDSTELQLNEKRELIEGNRELFNFLEDLRKKLLTSEFTKIYEDQADLSKKWETVLVLENECESQKENPNLAEEHRAYYTQKLQEILSKKGEMEKAFQKFNDFNNNLEVHLATIGVDKPGRWDEAEQARVKENIEAYLLKREQEISTITQEIENAKGTIIDILGEPGVLETIMSREVEQSDLAKEMQLRHEFSERFIEDFKLGEKEKDYPLNTELVKSMLEGFIDMEVARLLNRNDNPDAGNRLKTVQRVMNALNSFKSDGYHFENQLISYRNSYGEDKRRQFIEYKKYTDIRAGFPVTELYADYLYLLGLMKVSDSQVASDAPFTAEANLYNFSQEDRVQYINQRRRSFLPIWNIVKAAMDANSLHFPYSGDKNRDMYKPSLFDKRILNEFGIDNFRNTVGGYDFAMGTYPRWTDPDSRTDILPGHIHEPVHNDRFPNQFTSEQINEMQAQYERLTRFFALSGTTAIEKRINIAVEEVDKVNSEVREADKKLADARAELEKVEKRRMEIRDLNVGYWGREEMSGKLKRLIKERDEAKERLTSTTIRAAALLGFKGTEQKYTGAIQKINDVLLDNLGAISSMLNERIPDGKTTTYLEIEACVETLRSKKNNEYGELLNREKELESYNGIKSLEYDKREVDRKAERVRKNPWAIYSPKY